LPEKILSLRPPKDCCIFSAPFVLKEGTSLSQSERNKTVNEVKMPPMPLGPPPSKHKPDKVTVYKKVWKRAEGPYLFPKEFGST
jgi:hypothetical protein